MCVLPCPALQPAPVCIGAPATLPANAAKWDCPDQTEESGHCHAMCLDGFVGTPTAFCLNGTFQTPVGSCIREQGCDGVPKFALPTNAESWDCSAPDSFAREGDLCRANCRAGFTG